jgi:hypothetical protein
MREKKRAEHERYLAALMDPSFDPRKWIADQDRERAEQEAHMKESRTAWLAVWDSLDAGQRTQVREFLFKRAQHHGHHFGGHDHGDRGGMRPGDGGPGKMDSAPMPKQ